MNIRILYATGLLLLCGTAANAQIRIDSIRITKTGSRATVRFTGLVEPKATGRNEELTLTPVLYNDQESVSLPPVVVQTRRMRIMAQRDGERPLSGVLRTSKGKSFGYTAQIHYSAWLPGAIFRLDRNVAGCGSVRTLPPVFPASCIKILDGDTLHVPFGVRELILVKNRLPAPGQDTIGRKTAERLTRLAVDFTVNSAELRPSLHDNRRMLNELVGVLHTALKTSGIRIAITGYASPEGPVALNNELALKRAQVVRDYILENIPQISFSDIRLVQGGENWTGLLNAVSQSDMPGKENVLRIIDEVPAETSRKKRLMELDGGQAWRYMREEFFPHLRSAVSVTVHPVQRFGAPSLLQGADTNTEPIDRACGLIEAGRTEQALEILLPIKDDPRTWNPIGVCYLLQGDREQAQAYLQKAAEAGYGEAGENLEQYSTHPDNIQ